MKKLLDKYTDNDILKRLVEIYPDQSEAIKRPKGYKRVIKQLRKMKPAKTNLVVLPRKWHTGGKNPNVEMEYALDFTRWQEWLGMKVVTKRDGLTALCYCLWEMTYHGWSQQPIQRRINEMTKRINEIKTKVRSKGK